MADSEFRGDNNWLEEYLPLKWGGLLVFLCGLVYLLESYFFFITGSLYKNDQLFEKDPAIVAVLITNSIAWAGVTAVILFHGLIETDSTHDFTYFPWAYLQKYWRNNVVGVKLNFVSREDGTITVQVNPTKEWFFIRNQQETTSGRYGSRETGGRNTISFSIRCGGWFWRRNRKGEYHGNFVDFSKALKLRSFFAVYSFGYASSPMQFQFGIFDELMDFWHSKVSHSPQNSLKKYGKHADRVTELEAELQKCQELIAEKDMHISEFGGHLLSLYQTMAIAIAESSRLATNRESSALLRKLFDLGLSMREDLHHEFEHDPLKVDPQTNRHIEEMVKICQCYLDYINAKKAEAVKAAEQAKETKEKEKQNPAPQSPPA